MDNNINTNNNPEVIPETVPEVSAESAVIELPGEVNPEVIPAQTEADSVDAVIPEINTIGEINSLDEVVIAEPAAPEAPVVQEQTVEVLPEAAPAVPVYQTFDETPQAEVYPTGNIYQQTSGAAAPDAAYYNYTAAVPASSSKGDKLALAAFIVGLCSLAMTWGAYIGFICVLLGVAGIVLAAMARKNGVTTSFQKAGMTLSILGLVFSLFTGVACTACSSIATDYMEDMIPQEIMEDLQQGDTDSLEAYLNEMLAEYE